MTAYLHSLPADIRYRLLAAGCGKHHLLETGRAAMALAEDEPRSAPMLFDLAKNLYTAAWLADPLDGVLAADLAEFDRRLPGLSPAGVKCVNMAAKLCTVQQDPRTAAQLGRLEQAQAYPPLRDWLEKELALAPGNGFLAWCLYHHALDNGDFSTAQGVAARISKISPLAPAAAKLSADAHFLAGEYDRAVAAFDAVEQAFPTTCSDRAGEALYRMGAVENGMERLAKAVADTPWLVNAPLRLYDMTTGRDAAQAPLPGATAILLYSYNNADKLDQTLHSLYASLENNDANVLIRVLSNGSRDGTGQVMDGWKERFGDICDTVHLPVNVGAPQARNWLASLEAVRACEFATYLDDDVVLPTDWLSRFGAAVNAYPDAGLWGCRVTDYKRTTNLQQVDLNVLPPKTGDTHFSMSEAHLSAGDFGQFSYLRPTSSVTGCCHLFRTRTLVESGPFDIRFSPTQYDDLDHDLRLCLAGKQIVYQGHLAVEHMKISGRAATATPTALANASANMFKLQNKYSAAEIRTIRQCAMEMLEADLAAKLHHLGFAGEQTDQIT